MANRPDAPGGFPEQFRKYWLTGAGAGIVEWESPGAFDRCRTAINAKISEHGGHALPDHEISGLCARLVHEATGEWPGAHHGGKH